MFQGYNARKVISLVNAFFVLQCTVFGRISKHKADVTASHGIHLSHKKLMKYSGHRKLLCELSNFLNSMLLSSSDTKRTLIHSCLQIPPRENWFQYVRRVYATAINFPCIITFTLPAF